MYDPSTWRDYVVAIGMLSSFVFMVTGAWLLLVGVQATQAQESTRA